MEIERQRMQIDELKDGQRQQENKMYEMEEKDALLRLEIGRLRCDNEFLHSQNKNLT